MSDNIELTEEQKDEERKNRLREQLQRGKEAMAAKRAEGWKPVYLNPVDAAKANPGSMKAAIKAFCWTCVGQDADPGAKFRVRDCDVGPKCPLYDHRPWQKVKGRIKLTEDGELAPPDEDSEDTSSD